MSTIQKVELDSTLRCPDAVEFETRMLDRVVGQNDAVEKLSWIVQTFMAGFSPVARPAGVLLFLGPTGSGKTRIVESMADTLFDNPKAFTKINCGEFQHSHEISKLIGSPPGYTGHKDTDPVITQKKLDQFQNDLLKMNIFLLDEIEKGSEALWQLLLGILDKGELKNNVGEMIDFSKTIIIMTSNLGAQEMQNKGLGFVLQVDQFDKSDKEIASIAEKAVGNKFSPEFVNRIDHIVNFKALRPEHFPKILEIELRDIRRRIISVARHREFSLILKPAASDFITANGFSRKFGARELKRVLEKHVVQQVASLYMTGQIGLGDVVIGDRIENSKIKFIKIPGDVASKLSDGEWGHFKSVTTLDK
jgi:ATP-dependent Clp protease ATP-binding subunit ClpB